MDTTKKVDIYNKFNTRRERKKLEIKNEVKKSLGTIRW